MPTPPDLPADPGAAAGTEGPADAADPTDGMAAALAAGVCGDAFSFLGVHPDGPGVWIVRAFVPGARAVEVLRDGGATAMEPRAIDGLFVARFPTDGPFRYRLSIEGADGRQEEVDDPYRFPPTLDETRVEAFLLGRERRAHDFLGAVTMEVDGVRGTRFAVWAPHARTVNLTGEMNGWDGRRHPMRSRGVTGVWELFVPGVERGDRYKYQVVTRRGARRDKTDPFGRAMELRPATASEVWDARPYRWGDADWMDARGRRNADTAPMAVYEVHLGSWKRRPADERDDGDPGWLGYRELADTLLPYVRELGFTHVELLPVMEHPLDQSWGYQPLGFFAPTSRFGNPDDFRYFVDRAHGLGLGVLLDFVPGHFPSDAHGLAAFDGTPLFEHPDPLQARHPDWGTLVFDYGKPAVRSFLTSAALHWLEDYHVDGLRVDAVASMLYLDYSRGEGQWRPNREGGRENLEAVDFLRALNDAVHEEVPGALMVAEESTEWPRVSHGTDRGGLGFDQKWNMGWMNDTLEVMATDPLFRKGVYHRLTFSIMYAHSERFVLPFSHDEVVHGKGSLLGRMPGRDEDRFANLRLLLAYQWSHPGKKLLFMGQELGQWAEWNVDGQVDWALEAFAPHRGVRRLVAELNRLHVERPALHALDFRPEGFEWIDCHDAARTTLSFIRWGPDWSHPVVFLANFTPVAREDFRQALPHGGRWRVLVHTDAEEYGGRGAALPTVLETEPEPLHGREHSVRLDLPGLTAVVLAWEGDDGRD